MHHVPPDAQNKVANASGGMCDGRQSGLGYPPFGTKRGGRNTHTPSKSNSSEMDTFWFAVAPFQALDKSFGSETVAGRILHTTYVRNTTCKKVHKTSIARRLRPKGPMHNFTHP